MEPKKWWEKAKTLPALVEARRLHFEKEAKDSGEFLTGLVAEGTLSEHECATSIRRLKVKGLKYEWEGFLSATHLTSGFVENLTEKRKALDEETAKNIALVLECPKEIVYSVINGTAKGEKEVAKKELKIEHVEMDEEETVADAADEETENVEEETETESEESGEAEGEESVEEGAEADPGEAEPDGGEPEPAPKKRGRPKGSKNKPKDDSGSTDGKVESKPVAAVKPAKAAAPVIKPVAAKPAAKPVAAKPVVEATPKPAPAPKLSKNAKIAKLFGELKAAFEDLD
jgi:hypothetical protein